MTNDSRFDVTLRIDELRGVLSRVRQLDPAAEEAAVRGYVREMAEAGAPLDAIDLDDAPLPIAFSASWPDGDTR